jgi:hypothetical protein
MLTIRPVQVREYRILHSHSSRQVSVAARLGARSRAQRLSAHCAAGRHQRCVYSRAAGMTGRTAIGAAAKLTTAPPASARSLSSGQDRDKIPIGVCTILCIDHPLRSRRLLEHTADRYRNHNDMIRSSHQRDPCGEAPYIRSSAGQGMRTDKTPAPRAPRSWGPREGRRLM